jgi:hypothetical protein
MSTLTKTGLERFASPIPRAPDPASACFAILRRLRFMTFPAGRMAAASAILIRLEALLDRRDFRPSAILPELRRIESELLALGGRVDQELMRAFSEVRTVFPRAKLIAVKPKAKGANR